MLAVLPEMRSAYRDPLTALDAHRAALARELDEARAGVAEHERVRRIEQRLTRAVDRTERRPLPLLDSLELARPCKVRWEAMRGDDRTRHCAQCDQRVHSLSDLTKQEAEAFLQATKDQADQPCVSFYRRFDGTVLTRDCAVGVKAHRRRQKVVVVAAGASLLVVAVAQVYAHFTRAVVVHENTGGGL